ncbi:MAG: acyl-CoA thioesterase [Leptonema sp. (in: Bacteria)]|nr:acyl-CoA thioesterase [Leptonema sp. (in: bacteria)]
MDSKSNRFPHYRFEHHQYVAWGDMDSFGHLNNVAYVKYFENARVEFFRQLGTWTYEVGPEQGPVIVNLSMHYRKQVRYPNQLTITIGVSRLKKRSFSFVCTMFDKDDECVHSATADLLWVHFKRGSAVDVPTDVIDAFELYKI